MWPFDAWRPIEVLRLGRERVERWQWRGRGLSMIGEAALDGAMDPRALSDAIVRVFESGGPDVTAAATAPRRVDVVVESAWMPAMCLRTQDLRRTMPALESRLRERFAANFGDDGDPVARWALRIDGLPFRECVMGYAWSPSADEALRRALEVAGVVPASVQPALSWARGLPALRALARHRGWWLWPEQDRLLAVGLDRGTVVAFNPAVPRVDGLLAAPVLSARENARADVDLGGDVVASAWREAPRLGDGMRWLGPVVEAGGGRVRQEGAAS